MRKLICGMHISLDGYLTGQGNDLSWSGPGSTDEVLESILDLLRETDTIVLGSGGFEEMAGYWPTADGDMADLMNSHPKVVISGTLRSADAWPNARVVNGAVADEIEKLKQEPGRDMIVYGGARFAQAVARQGLFDEYRLMTHPVAIGAGVPLFQDLPAPQRLALLSSRTFEGGTVQHVYRPR